MIAVSREVLLGCCAAPAWAEAVAAGAPYPRFRDLLAHAERVWWAAGPDVWRAALAAHPRIGDRPAAGSTEAREQNEVHRADPGVLSAIDAGNVAYEERFGMTYVVRARGRSAEEMLALLRTRLDNEPAEELRVAAEQQWEITALRLADAVGVDA